MHTQSDKTHHTTGNIGSRPQPTVGSWLVLGKVKLFFEPVTLDRLNIPQQMKLHRGTSGHTTSTWQVLMCITKCMTNSGVGGGVRSRPSQFTAKFQASLARASSFLKAALSQNTKDDKIILSCYILHIHWKPMQTLCLLPPVIMLGTRGMVSKPFPIFNNHKWFLGSSCPSWLSLTMCHVDFMIYILIS